VARTLGWALLFGGNSGVINKVLMQLDLIAAPIPFMFTEIGVTVALARVLMPFMVLAVSASLQRLDPQIEHAAASLGASQPTILRKVILPQVMPGILSGAIIVFALAASSFAKVASTLIYDEFLNSLNWPLGAVIATILLVALIAIVTGSNRLVERRYAEVSREPERPLALAFHCAFVIFMLAPIVVVCVVAFTPEGYLSFPTHGFSCRWFRAIAD